MAALEIEIKTYQAQLPQLLAQAGKFVLIKGEDVVGTYDTYEDALKTGYERFGVDPFMVKKIAPAEQVLFITRDVTAACPA